MTKNFKKEFEKFCNKLYKKEPFSFCRFSDGEFFIIKNQEVKLAENHYITGNIKGPGVYTKEEQKHFLPGRDEFYRQELIKSLKHKQEGYYKGICSRTDISVGDFNLQLEIAESKEDDEDLTFANLFINSNYQYFIPAIVNTVFPLRNIAMVCNEACKLDNLPFKVLKEFRIGNNCMVTNYSTIEEVRNFLQDRKGWLVLCSAASLSNLISYYCFKDNSENTIIDIGSSLNPYMGLEGWKYSRDYLKHYWMGIKSQFCLREEEW